MKLLKEPNANLLDYYKKYFIRTTQKFIRRTPLIPEDYNRKFKIGNEEFLLLGQPVEANFIVKNLSDGNYYMVLPKEVESYIVKARENDNIKDPN